MSLLLTQQGIKKLVSEVLLVSFIYGALITARQDTELHRGFSTWEEDRTRNLEGDGIGHEF